MHTENLLPFYLFYFIFQECSEKFELNHACFSLLEMLQEEAVVVALMFSIVSVSSEHLSNPTELSCHKSSFERSFNGFLVKVHEIRSVELLMES